MNTELKPVANKLTNVAILLTKIGIAKHLLLDQNCEIIFYSSVTADRRTREEHYNTWKINKWPYVVTPIKQVLHVCWQAKNVTHLIN